MLDQRYSRISSNLPAENVIPDDDKGQLSKLLAKLADRSHMETLRRRAYFDHLMRLQAELVNLQEWVQHHGVKIAMFQRTHIAEAPWWVVDAVDKRRARLNCIQHFLSLVPYRPIDQSIVPLPELVDKQCPTRISVAEVNMVPASF